jgi:hypothetical protein
MCELGPKTEGKFATFLSKKTVDECVNFVELVFKQMC